MSGLWRDAAPVVSGLSSSHHIFLKLFKPCSLFTPTLRCINRKRSTQIHISNVYTLHIRSLSILSDVSISVMGFPSRFFSELGQVFSWCSYIVFPPSAYCRPRRSTFGHKFHSDAQDTMLFFNFQLFLYVYVCVFFQAKQ